MRNLVICLCTIAILSGSAFAQEETKKKRRNRKRGNQSPVMALMKDIELTDEQKEQLKPIAKEFDPKLMEINKENQSFLTDDQKKAQSEVRKANKEAGLKGKEAQAKLTAALNLTDEQKTQRKETQKKRMTVMKELRGKLAEILTDEQKTKVQGMQPRGKGKRKRKNKSAA